MHSTNREVTRTLLYSRCAVADNQMKQREAGWYAPPNIYVRRPRRQHLHFAKSAPPTWTGCVSRKSQNVSCLSLPVVTTCSCDRARTNPPRRRHTLARQRFARSFHQYSHAHGALDLHQAPLRRRGSPLAIRHLQLFVRKQPTVRMRFTNTRLST